MYALVLGWLSSNNHNLLPFLQGMIPTIGMVPFDTHWLQLNQVSLILHSVKCCFHVKGRHFTSSLNSALWSMFGHGCNELVKYLFAFYITLTACVSNFIDPWTRIARSLWSSLDTIHSESYQLLLYWEARHFPHPPKVQIQPQSIRFGSIWMLFE